MNRHIVSSGVAALFLGATLISFLSLPAKADTNTTRTVIEGAAAAAAIFTAVNVEHKHQLATTVQGYLSDGSTVYKDGRVVSPNGNSWYPGNTGESVACSNQYCSISGGYYGNNGGYYGNNGNNGGYYGNNGNNGYYRNNGGYYGNNGNNGGYYGNSGYIQSSSRSGHHRHRP